MVVRFSSMVGLEIIATSKRLSASTTFLLAHKRRLGMGKTCYSHLDIWHNLSVGAIGYEITKARRVSSDV